MRPAVVAARLGDFVLLDGHRATSISYGPFGPVSLGSAGTYALGAAVSNPKFD